MKDNIFKILAKYQYIFILIFFILALMTNATLAGGKSHLVSGRVIGDYPSSSTNLSISYNIYMLPRPDNVQSGQMTYSELLGLYKFTYNLHNFDNDIWTNGEEAIVFYEDEEHTGESNRVGYYGVANLQVAELVEPSRLNLTNFKEIPTPNAKEEGAGLRVFWPLPEETAGFPVTDNIIGYHLYRSESSTSNFQLVTDNVIATINYLDRDISDPRYYYYAVKLVYRGNVSGNIYSANSDSSRLTTPFLPSVNINSILPSYKGVVSSSVTVMGSVSDNFGIDYFVLKDDQGNTVNYFSSVITENGILTENWSINLLGGGEHQITLSAVNIYGLEKEIGYTVTVDLMPPGNINDIGYSSVSVVTQNIPIGFNVTDDYSTVVAMKISGSVTDNIFVSVNKWIPYRESISIDIVNSTENEVYFCFKDGVGHVSDVATISISIDTGPPVIKFVQGISSRMEYFKSTSSNNFINATVYGNTRPDGGGSQDITLNIVWEDNNPDYVEVSFNPPVGIGVLRAEENTLSSIVTFNIPVNMISTTMTITVVDEGGLSSSGIVYLVQDNEAPEVSVVGVSSFNVLVTENFRPTEDMDYYEITNIVTLNIVVKDNLSVQETLLMMITGNITEGWVHDQRFLKGEWVTFNEDFRVSVDLNGIAEEILITDSAKIKPASIYSKRLKDIIIFIKDEVQNVREITVQNYLPLPPTMASVVIEDNQSQIDYMDVELSLSAIDDIEVVQMVIWGDINEEESETLVNKWIPYKPTANVVLSNGNAVKHVYVKYRDSGKLSCKRVVDTIVFNKELLPNVTDNLVFLVSESRDSITHDIEILSSDYDGTMQSFHGLPLENKDQYVGTTNVAFGGWFSSFNAGTRIDVLATDSSLVKFASKTVSLSDSLINLGTATINTEGVYSGQFEVLLSQGEYPLILKLTNIIGTVTTSTKIVVDYTAPQVGYFKLDGQIVVSGDVIGNQPEIEARLVDTYSPIVTSSISIVVDEGRPDSAIYNYSDYSSEMSFIDNELTFTLPTIFPEVSTHSISLILEDIVISSNRIAYSLKDLQVLGGEARLLRGPVANPNPFNPLSSNPNYQVTRIAYELSNDMDIELRIYNTIGELEWRRELIAGEPGARIGYNEVVWNGNSEFGGLLGNGVYILHLLSEGKVLKSYKIVILK